MTTPTMPARRWGDEPRQPHPAPEVPCRDAAEGEIPAAAKRMRAAAEAAGWTVRATYARGTTVSRVPKVVDSLALRMRRGARAAVAVWVDGKFSLGVRSGGGFYLTRVGARELTKWLDEAEPS